MKFRVEVRTVMKICSSGKNGLSVKEKFSQRKLSQWATFCSCLYDFSEQWTSVNYKLRKQRKKRKTMEKAAVKFTLKFKRVQRTS